MPSRHAFPTRLGEVFEHAGVLQDEGGVRKIRREPRRARHLAAEDLQVEGKIVVGERRKIPAEGLVVGEIGAAREAVLRVLVPVQLHAHAAHQRILLQPVELRAHVLGQQIGIADDRVRPAAFVGGLLHPRDLVLGALLRPVRLHVDGFFHAAAGDVGEIFLDRIVAADFFVGPEDARQHRAGEPGQIGLPPDVMMRVDDGNGHEDATPRLVVIAERGDPAIHSGPADPSTNATEWMPWSSHGMTTITGPRGETRASDKHLLLDHVVEAAGAMRGGVAAGGLAFLGARSRQAAPRRNPTTSR